MSRITPHIELCISNNKANDYIRYRGKCKEYCEYLISHVPRLKLVRGFYWCPVWNKEEQHWWCVDTDGEIIDPTVYQFGSKGGIYTEFNGICTCDECGEQIKEEHARFDSNYIFCSTKCNMKFVGLL